MTVPVSCSTAVMLAEMLNGSISIEFLTRETQVSEEVRLAQPRGKVVIVEAVDVRCNIETVVRLCPSLVS